MAERLTMQDLAERAGVSPSTVSRALANHPRIPEPTRLRIQDLAKTLGYRPNPLVSALVRTRHDPRAARDRTTVIMLTGYTARELRETIYLSRFVHAAEQRANELGYRLEHCYIGSQQDLAKVDRVLRARGTEGVLIGPFRMGTKLELDWTRLAYASIGLDVVYPLGHRAENDQGQAMQLVLDRVVERGYKRPALTMLGLKESYAAAQYRRAFTDWQVLADAPRIPVLESFTFEETRFVAWLRRHKPDVVLANHVLVHPVLERLRSRQPIAFASVDLQPPATPAAEQTFARVAGVMLDYGAVGAGAFDLVEGQLHRNERGVPTSRKLVLFEGRFKDGPSLPKIESAPS
jgi:LacI family transcriptional regulator